MCWNKNYWYLSNGLSYCFVCVCVYVCVCACVCVCVIKFAWAEEIAIFLGRHGQEWSCRLKVSQNNNTATSWLSCCFDFCIKLLSVELRFHTILGGYGRACNILPRCVETNYYCLYTCLSYIVNLLHVINYFIFDKHGQEFKIPNGNNKNSTNQSANIFSSVTIKRLFCQSVCWIGQSVTLRPQIFAELIFRIYDLIRKIKFHKFKK